MVAMLNTKSERKRFYEYRDMMIRIRDAGDTRIVYISKLTRII
jgi:hypothetical protein